MDPTFFGPTIFFDSSFCFSNSFDLKFPSTPNFFDKILFLNNDIFGIKFFWVRTGQVRTGQARTGQDRTGQVKSGKVKSGLVKSGQVKSGN